MSSSSVATTDLTESEYAGFVAKLSMMIRSAVVNSLRNWNLVISMVTVPVVGVVLPVVGAVVVPVVF